MNALGPLQPAGITPASAWETLEWMAVNQPVVLVPKLDPRNGEVLSLIESDDPTYQAIATEFRTMFGTGGAVQNFGHKLNAIRKNNTSAPTEIRFEVDRILEPHIKARKIRVDTLDIVAGPNAGHIARITLKFTLLATGKQMTMEFAR